MSSRAPLRVLFAVAAGPRIGFGHLIRARSLARALGVEPLVTLRGTAATRRRASSLGCRIVRVESDPTLRRVGADLVVVDDPVRSHVEAWVRRARRAGVPVATVHDLGIAATRSDLVIDGTVARATRVRGRFGTLRGPAYMILDPSIARVRARTVSPRPRVLIALGGGSSAAGAAALASAIEAAAPGIDVRVAGGFVGRRRGPDGLALELARSTVAVVAGGVTLYEACALGVPAIAVPVSAGQRITVRAIARAGAAVAVTPVVSGFSRTIARHVAHLLDDAAARQRLSRAGRRLVDGQGAFRVAAALKGLVRRT